MILIHPPISKPCEPPAGIAHLAGTLNRHGIEPTIIDANIEGILFFLTNSQTATDTWTRRAAAHSEEHYASLQREEIYRHPARYRRAVMDLNRLLSVSALSSGVHISFANYQDAALSPLRSPDLIQAAETPENNPFYPYFTKRLTGLIEKSASPVVGFSVNYLSQALCAFAMIGFIKKIDHAIRIVCGGGLITSWMKSPTWNNPFYGLVDTFIAGAGEIPLLTFLGKTASETRSTPDYDTLFNYRYVAPGRILPYSASRGCYWNRCSFCPEKAEGTPYQPVPHHNAIEDIHHITQRNNPTLLHLLDNAISPALLASLIDHPPGIPWYGFARITRHLADLDFCHALKRSGCVMLKLGLESGDQDVLDRLGKGIDLETASQALKNLGKAGIATYIYLLFGTPFETATEATRTLEFTAAHSETIGFLNLALFNLPALSPEAQLLETRDFYEGDLCLYRQFTHPKGWHRHAVRTFIEKEFKRHPAIAPIIRRNPPFFTSNHASFFATAK